MHLFDTTVFVEVPRPDSRASTTWVDHAQLPSRQALLSEVWWALLRGLDALGVPGGAHRSIEEAQRVRNRGGRVEAEQVGDELALGVRDGVGSRRRGEQATVACAAASVAGEAEFGGGIGDLCVGGNEPETAPECERQSDTGTGTVHRSDDRQSVAQLPHEVCVQPVTAAGNGGFGGGSPLS